MQFANYNTIIQIMETNGNKYCNPLTLGHYPRLRVSVLSLFFFGNFFQVISTILKQHFSYFGQPLKWDLPDSSLFITFKLPVF